MDRRSQPTPSAPAGASAAAADTGFVLVHSPLLGPASWAAVADMLRSAGRRVAVPRLTAAISADTGQSQATASLISETAKHLGTSVILAGHSGGGLLLTSAASRITTGVAGLVFVDSDLPHTTGRTPLAPLWFRQHLETLAADGVLPVWSEWWEPDTMRTLVPDAAVRARLEREMPKVPLSWFDQVIDEPADWDATPCGYILLGDGYREHANDARARGWPVIEMPHSEHLHIAVDADGVAAALLRLAAVMARPAERLRPSR